MPVLSFKLTALCGVLSSWLPASVHADEWPQWRGPDGNNLSKESAWNSEGAAAPLWRAAIGRGYSSPSVSGGCLVIDGYFPSASEEGAGEDRVQCFDALSGALRWSLSFPALAYDNEHRGGTLGTPTIANDTVYLLARDGGLRAVRLKDGQLLWHVDLCARHGVSPGRYGFASAPYVDGERLLVNASRTIAVNRRTSETDWISDERDAAYSTVAPIQLGERAGYVVFGGRGVAVLDARDGALLHEYSFRKTPRNVEGATPIVVGTKVIVSSGYEQGAACIDFGGAAPVELWRSRHMRTKLAGATLYEGHLYGFDESMLKCLDENGEERWRVRGIGQGALMIAAGRLLLTSSDGELIVAQASPQAFIEETRRAVLDEGVFWTAPVLANGCVYYRGSEGELVCLDHRLDLATSSTPSNALASEPSVAAQALPTPAELERKYLAAAQLPASGVPALRLRGKLHIVALGIDNSSALWEIGPPNLWHANYALPPGIGGNIDRCFDGTQAWEKNPYRGDKLMAEHELNELRRTQGGRDLFDPLPAGQAAETKGIAMFRGERCFEVELQVEREPCLVRKIYFAVESGMMLGRTAAFESTVTWSDWRDVGALRLPFAHTLFDAESGIEQRWTFDTATLEGPEGAIVELPESLRKN